MFNSLIKVCISKINNLFFNRFKNQTSKAVIVLVIGTFVTQLISIICSPILTRIYAPSIFGGFAIFNSFLSILLVFSTLRYDLSIFEPKFNLHSKYIVQFSFFISLIFSFITLISIFLFKENIIKILGNNQLKDIIYLIPLGVLLVSSVNLVTSWSNRLGLYEQISKARIISNSVNIILSILLGYYYGGILMMVTAFLVGQLSNLFFLRKDLYNLFKNLNFQKKKIFVLLKTYKEYPLFLIPATLSSEISGAIPIILLSKYFNLETTGFFVLALKMTTIPVTFLANSISEVYRQKASEYFAIYGNCKDLFLSTFKKLLIITTPFFLFVFFFSSYFFPLIFGNKWLISGQFAQIISVMVFFQMLSSPLSYTIVFNKSQKYDMFLQFYRLFFSFVAIYIGYYFRNSTLSIVGYSVVFSSYYIFHSFLQYKASCGKV